METEKLITKFLALALMYIHEHKNIAFYAERMQIDALELNALLYDVNGKEFHEWIEWLDTRI